MTIVFYGPRDFDYWMTEFWMSGDLLLLYSKRRGWGIADQSFEGCQQIFFNFYGNQCGCNVSPVVAAVVLILAYVPHPSHLHPLLWGAFSRYWHQLIKSMKLRKTWDKNKQIKQQQQCQCCNTRKALMDGWMVGRSVCHSGGHWWTTQWLAGWRLHSHYQCHNCGIIIFGLSLPVLQLSFIDDNDVLLSLLLLQFAVEGCRNLCHLGSLSYTWICLNIQRFVYLPIANSSKTMPLNDG